MSLQLSHASLSFFRHAPASGPLHLNIPLLGTFDSYISTWLVLWPPWSIYSNSWTNQFATPPPQSWHFLTHSLLYLIHHITYDYVFAFCPSPFTKIWAGCRWGFSSILFTAVSSVLRISQKRLSLNICWLTVEPLQQDDLLILTTSERSRQLLFSFILSQGNSRAWYKQVPRYQAAIECAPQKESGVSPRIVIQQ